MGRDCEGAGRCRGVEGARPAVHEEVWGEIHIPGVRGEGLSEERGWAVEVVAGTGRGPVDVRGGGGGRWKGESIGQRGGRWGQEESR